MLKFNFIKPYLPKITLQCHALNVHTPLLSVGGGGGGGGLQMGGGVDKTSTFRGGFLVKREGDF